MGNRNLWIGIAVGIAAIGITNPGAPTAGNPLFDVMGWGTAARGQDAAMSPRGAAADFSQHLASGEFAAARQVIGQTAPEHRPALQRQLAIAQAAAGDIAAATATAAGIEANSARADLFANLRGAGYGAEYGGGRGGRYAASSGSASAAPRREPVGSGAAGGGALADFDSLMELIQTTIAPDTWEVLGGPSTMAPYRAGIHVDLDGFVRDLPVDRSDSLAALRTWTLDPQAAANSAANTDWTRSAELRLVSLRRLREELLRCYVAGREPPLAMQNLAGLSRIQYIFIGDQDLLIAGPVGGIDPAAAPWPRDRRSGRTTLGIDQLAAAATAVVTETPFGCSIDPTAAGLVAAQKVSAGIAAGTQPPGNAADALAEALGRQVISLYGTPADRPLAWLMVDADRHMKQLALGRRPMPDGVPNYLDLVEREVRAGRGVPSGQLLRMWFAVQPIHARRSTDGKAFEIGGRPIRLLTAKEAAGEEGERRQVGHDPVGEAFAKSFTEHFEEIAAAYPVYDRLRGVFELTAAMKLVFDHTDARTFESLVGELALPDLISPGGAAVPRECDSIAVRHTILAHRHRHEVYVASGGVDIDPATTLAAAPAVYPSLDALTKPADDRPIANTRWWWDR